MLEKNEIGKGVCLNEKRFWTLKEEVRI